MTGGSRVVVGPARQEQQPRVSAAAVAETPLEPQPAAAQPTAGAAPDSTAAVAQGPLAPLGDDGPMCVFCQMELGRHSPVEALLCGHTFHTACIDDYIAATNKARTHCCPFKCRSQDFVTVGVFEDPEHLIPLSPVAPVVDGEVADLAALASADAAAHGI